MLVPPRCAKSIQRVKEGGEHTPQPALALELAYRLFGVRHNSGPLMIAINLAESFDGRCWHSPHYTSQPAASNNLIADNPISGRITSTKQVTINPIRIFS